jgi:hypothetical protein
MIPMSAINYGSSGACSYLPLEHWPLGLDTKVKIWIECALVLRVLLQTQFPRITFSHGYHQRTVLTLHLPQQNFQELAHFSIYFSQLFFFDDSISCYYCPRRLFRFWPAFECETFFTEFFGLASFGRM